ncbi:acyl-CoA dehydrogenase family protein [Rubrivirga sp. S365]|uniref:Acyl-CoA dehydrogenase family protein n=1 Tax=Rubrivirga litoralis TaxID=3075598 RepID=A0ABU3BSH4_9BACT|nr:MULTISPECIES: acyl-CoA dehydrogenase family protein [unclassified Rubrivirga]MDT0632247.1 acyl-CoA dehydrogenase family protein [Rubrivirga sp. F394]MDT7856373.1 acyl-CoA dehydrogenase family protein [Rubrivirga sp. S365]
MDTNTQAAGPAGDGHTADASPDAAAALRERGVDLDAVAALADRLDVNALVQQFAGMDEASVAQAQKSLAGAGRPKEAFTPPEPNGDYYDIEGLITGEQHRKMAEVREFMETEVEPVINEAWLGDRTPLDVLVPGFRKLDLLTPVYGEDLSTRRPNGSVMEGLLTMEIARVDVSTATFFGVHSGLAMQSILVCGSEEQKAEWLPKMRNWETIGAFGLTEPHVGSAIAGGVETTARREGDEWVLNGQKKWIGNATFADMVVIWAVDEADRQVKGFIVRPKENPGYSVEKLRGKVALRAVENGEITLTDCVVPESDRLQEAHSFKEVAEILKLTRAGVAWQAVGCAMGAYERSQRYATTRMQFGKPIASFQLIQDKLVHMLGNVTALQTMCLRLSQLQDAGEMSDAQASLAKVFTAARCREVVALARDLHGGNGILLENHVARYFCDTEAIYSYEGTNEVNSLIVGRAVTGIGAFV